jgi:hypothetical protein
LPLNKELKMTKIEKRDLEQQIWALTDLADELCGSDWEDDYLQDAFKSRIEDLKLKMEG